MENALIPILLLAAMGEAIWQTLKLVWEKDATKKFGKFHPDKIGALAVGILIAFGSGLDLPAMVGIPMSIPYLGIILTGILISRGAGFVHDLLTYLKSLKEILLTKSNQAVIERNGTGVLINSKNLTPGTKVNIDTSGTKTGLDKTREMIGNIANTANRVVRVIKSTPAGVINVVEAEKEKISEDTPQPNSSDTPEVKVDDEILNDT